MVYGILTIVFGIRQGATQLFFERRFDTMKDPSKFCSSVQYLAITMTSSSSGAGARGRGSTDLVGGLTIST